MGLLRFVGAVVVAVIVFIVVNTVLGGGAFLLGLFGVLPPRLTLFWAPAIAPFVATVAAVGSVWWLA